MSNDEIKNTSFGRGIASGVATYTLHPDLVHFIISALQERDSSRIKEHLESLHASDITELLHLLTAEQRQLLIEIAGDVINPESLVDLEPDVREEIFKHLGVEESAAAITQLETDDAVQAIEDLELKDQRDIIDALPEGEQRNDLEEALSYPEDTAGRLVEKNFVAVSQGWTVGQTIDFLRDAEELTTDFHNIFVIDRFKKPVGSVLVSRVIRNKRSVKIKDIMDSNIKIIDKNTDQEDVAYLFRKYGLSSAPVVDDEGKMTGVISIDDVVDIIDEEAEEDFMRFSGVAETDLHVAFLETSRRRFPWLLVNLFTAIAASVVIAMFDYAIEKLVALAVLMPIVASMAGNAGTQTLAVAIRGLATKELSSANSSRIIKKEMLSSFFNGVLFAVIVGLASYAIYHNVMMSIVFAFAMIVSLVIAAFAGAFIPVLLFRIGVDPAISSAVFLTTITDLTAFFIFLGLSAAILI